MTRLYIFFLLQAPGQFLQESTQRASTWFDTLTSSAVLLTLFEILIKIGGAVLALVIGRWLISYAVRMVDRTLKLQKVDPTLIRYSVSTLTVLLNVGLIIAILGFFGFETTTFAALLAGAGLAVGGEPSQDDRSLAEERKRPVPCW